MKPTLRSRHQSFGGWMEFYTHPSQACSHPMHFSVFRPPQEKQGRVPILYFLSGLTCTDENFMVKAGIQRLAAQMGFFVVNPDTSPRKTGIPGEADHWELGAGASFYVDATQSPWKSHYQMYSYVTEELPKLIHQNFGVDPQKEYISGHSMGGHGALVAALRQPGRYRAVGAFSPIVAPVLCPWGKKAFGAYLGPDEIQWEKYDTSKLFSKGEANKLPPLRIDQGEDDAFLKEQLLLPVLEELNRAKGNPIQVHRHAGYDHSYYFVSTFLEEHLHSLGLK